MSSNVEENACAVQIAEMYSRQGHLSEFKEGNSYAVGYKRGTLKDRVDVVDRILKESH